MKNSKKIQVKKLRKLVTNQLNSIPDSVFLQEIRFKKYFSKKVINDIEEGKINFRWLLSRIHFDNMVEKLETRKKKEVVS